jgi:acetylornithine deacetylase/succinyl-diaminopimelate desuccinylase-like protein
VSLLASAPAAVPSTAVPTVPDWPAVHAQTIEHLQRLIRINTVNPPGNELAAARYLESVLVAAGIQTRLFEPAPGRAALVARLTGDGSRRPVVLMGHMDVVGVEAEKWSVEPFGGVVRDGYLYGRGAIDDKGMLASNLVTMLLLKRHVLDAGGALARDVVFVANSDEEETGEWGMGWLIAHHPELVRGEFALNEGGRTRVVRGRPLYVAVQTAEKASHVVAVSARGPGGHASVPLEGNALFRLGRALAAIGAWRPPTFVTPTTRRFFTELARVWPERHEARAMADVASGGGYRVKRGAEVLRRVPVLDAVLRTGVSAVMTQGGIRSNVIPTDASATLNVRTLPGQSIDSVVRRLRRVVNDPLVTIAVTERGADSPASDFDSPMFRAIADATRELDPTMVTVPYLSTGATDSARLRSWGMQAFGVLPFPMSQDDEDRMHGHDERIPLASLAFGTRLIYGTVLRVAGK